MEAMQLRVACRSGCDSEILVSQEEARRPIVGGTNPSFGDGQSRSGGAVQYTATGTSPFALASSAREMTRLIPASTQALRAIGQDRLVVSDLEMMGTKLTGQIAFLLVSCSGV